MSEATHTLKRSKRLRPRSIARYLSHGSGTSLSKDSVRIAGVGFATTPTAFRSHMLTNCWREIKTMICEQCARDAGVEQVISYEMSYGVGDLLK